jgi:hypothetical protein
VGNTPAEKPVSTNRGLSSGAIAGIAIGVLAAVALFAGLCLWRTISLRKRRKARPSDDSEESENVKEVGNVEGLGITENGAKVTLPEKLELPVYVEEMRKVKGLGITGHPEHLESPKETELPGKIEEPGKTEVLEEGLIIGRAV